jgi:hypothetical protein
VKHSIVASRHGPRRNLSSAPVLRPAFLAGLVLASLATLALTACNALRFPGLTPESPNPSEVAPILTPTLAPLLLTPVPTPTPEPTSATASPSATPTFGLVLKPTCRSTPMWGLGEVWKNEAVYARLGCPLDEQAAVQGEEVHFEHGQMLSRPDANLIYVFLERTQPQGWGAYVDTFQSFDPDSDSTVIVPTPALGGQILVQPTGRFGKLWRENAWLRDKLGWAVARSPQDKAQSISGFTGAAQDFDGGILFWNGHVCFVLRTDDMSWDMY